MTSASFPCTYRVQGPDRVESLGGVLRIPREWLPTAWIVGSAWVEGTRSGDTEIHPTLLLDGKRSSLSTAWSEQDGSFRIGPLMPGKYELQLRCPDALPLTLDSVDVTSDQERDVGKLRLRAAAAVVIELAGAAAEPPIRISLQRQAEPRDSPIGASIHGSVLEWRNLQPGEYVVKVIRRGELVATTLFQALAGVETRLLLSGEN